MPVLIHPKRIGLHPDSTHALPECLAPSDALMNFQDVGVRDSPTHKEQSSSADLTSSLNIPAPQAPDQIPVPSDTVSDIGSSNESTLKVTSKETG